jgi:hypothetical protein
MDINQKKIIQSIKDNSTEGNLYFFRNNIFLISFQVNICISLLFFSSIFIEYNQRGLSRPFRK